MAETAPDAEVQLKEVTNPETAKTVTVVAKVIQGQEIKYTFDTKDGKKEGCKWQVTLLTHDAQQYCLGVVKMQRNSKTEFQEQMNKWKVNTVWKFKGIMLEKGEKSAYINSQVRIAINLRKTDASAMLQSGTFPATPEPTTTVKDIFALREYQRFDIICLVKEITDERQASGQIVCDCRLVDGSTMDDGTFACLPLTIWFPDRESVQSFKECVDNKTAICFMALQGRVEQGVVNVTTVKELTWWKPAKGDKAKTMEAAAQTLWSALRRRHCSFRRRSTQKFHTHRSHRLSY